jgi:2-deoxy-D-gluconate 3-dehydrogenase
MKKKPEGDMTEESETDQLPLTGRTALIAGASEGIGRGIAVGLARAGADVVLCSRRESPLREVATEIAALGRRAIVQTLDVSERTSVVNAGESVAAQIERLDILVNSAGFSADGTAWELGEADVDQIVDIGLKGLFYTAQVFGALMRPQGYGKVINLSSTFAIGSASGSSMYAAVKAGVSSLTRTLAVEWAGDGIRVNAIAPTSTGTPSREGRRTPEQVRQFESTVPLGRRGTPEDLVPTAVFLSSAGSDFITGQTIFVDGGVSVR